MFFDFQAVIITHNVKKRSIRVNPDDCQIARPQHAAPSSTDSPQAALRTKPPLPMYLEISSELADKRGSLLAFHHLKSPKSQRGVERLISIQGNVADVKDGKG